MIENFIPNGFVPEHAVCSDPLDNDLILCFNDNKILVGENGRIPRWESLKPLVGGLSNQFYYFGRLDQQRFLLVDYMKNSVSNHPAFHFRPVKLAYESFGESTYRLAGLACQLHHWRSTHVFCGHCGAQNLDKEDERAKICSRCQLLSYPNLYPCVIVLVSRGTELLLARSPHFQPKIYSTLAGFIEPGESAENAVYREVKEEVNISTKNIRYITSQPWPFPNSLMLGFLAEYESGEIKIDKREIEDAQWFKPTQLPPLPSTLGISHWLINTFKA